MIVELTGGGGAGGGVYGTFAGVGSAAGGGGGATLWCVIDTSKTWYVQVGGGGVGQSQKSGGHGTPSFIAAEIDKNDHNMPNTNKAYAIANRGGRGAKGEKNAVVKCESGYDGGIDDSGKKDGGIYKQDWIKFSDVKYSTGKAGLWYLDSVKGGIGGQGGDDKPAAGGDVAAHDVWATKVTANQIQANHPVGLWNGITKQTGGKIGTKNGVNSGGGGGGASRYGSGGAGGNGNENNASSGASWGAGGGGSGEGSAWTAKGTGGNGYPGIVTFYW